MPSKLRPLWQCPKCGERFVTRNMWHSCGRYSLESLFAGCEPHVFQIFQKFAKMVRACGPVKIIPQKTRICFQVRVRFVGAIPRKSYLLASFFFRRKHNHPRFLKIESPYPRAHVHQIRLNSEEELDGDFERWIREAYAVGEQKGLEKRHAHSSKRRV